MITQTYNYILFIHVIAGAIGLVSGIIAMAARKKSASLHTKSGISFYWGMFIVFITSILFVVIDPLNIKYHFFLGIGMVSFYPAWTGKRVLKMKKELKPTWVDTLGLFLIFTSGLLLIAYGISGVVGYLELGSFTALFILFGLLSILNAYGDYKRFYAKAKPSKLHWFFTHGSKYTGSLAAAFTAFFVNVVPQRLPENTPDFVYVATWVLPGVLVGYIGTKILKKYKKKFGL